MKRLIQNSKLQATFFLVFSFFCTESVLSQTISTPTVSPTTVCAGTTVTITFTATSANGTVRHFTNTTVFQPYLSTVGGVFPGTALATFTNSSLPTTGTNGASYPNLTAVITIPLGTTPGTVYKIALGTVAGGNPAINQSAGGNASANFTVVATPTGGSVSGGATVCSGTNSTTLTLSGNTGSVSKWQYSTVSDFSSGVVDVINTTTSLTATNLTATRYYRAVVISGSCTANSLSATVTVTPNNTFGAASSSPTLCLNTALTPITHTTTGATGIGSATGLPAGVTASWASNTITISGTPTASGTFNYTIPLTGGCGSINATGTITVSPNNTVSAASSTPTLCIITALTAITHTTTGATGIGSATGLPSGVTASWASNTITISGTPTASGTFNYTIPLTGGCGSVNASGTITVTPNNTVGAASSTPTLCISTPLTAITHTTSGAIGIGSATGLPAGVTTSWAANTITISGAPTASGTFNYSIPLTGGCGSVNAIGTIIVYSDFTAGAIETTGDTVCYNGNPNLGIESITNASGGDGSITYVWQANGVDIPDTNSETFDPPPGLTVTTTYARFAKDNTCNTTFTQSTGSWVVTISTANNWTGATSTDWATASNWSCGVVPEAVSNVTISTSTNYPIISSNVTINGLTLNAVGNTLKVNSNYDLTVTDVINNNGTLTIENAANLIQVNNVVNIGSGTTTVKRNSSAIKRLDYTLWSSPVTGQGLYAFSPLTLSTRFYQYLTSTNFYNNSGLGFSISGADPVTGIGGSDTANIQFATAKSYLIRAPWNHPTAPAVWAGSFSGIANNGNIPVTVSTAGEPIFGYGYNAVGNPYPSRLSVPDFINANTNISGTLYFWRKTNDNTTSSYATLTTTAYVANGAPGGDTGTGFFSNEGDAEEDWVINVGQGFFVKVESGSTVNFTNSMRRSSNTNQFFRDSPAVNTVNNGLYWLNLNTGIGVYSQMAVGYSSEGTLDFDRGIDGENINKDFYLTSIINTEEYSIQGRPSFEASDVVPLSYKVVTAGNYSISIDHTSGLFAEGQLIYLRDNLTSTIHDLSTGAYNFTSEVGTFASRFEVMYQLALGSETPTFNANQVVIYQNDVKDFVINTGNIVMLNVKIFDVRGRMLLNFDGINASQATLAVGQTNEVLLVQITSQEGLVVTKKVIR